MSFIRKLFGRRDPWEGVPQAYATALSAQLSPEDFSQLTTLLTTAKQFTPRMFPETLADRPARLLREWTAAQLTLMAFQVSQQSAASGSGIPGLGRSAHPGAPLICEALRLSFAIEPTANAAGLLLPGYLLETGDAQQAVDVATRVLPEWERRFAAPIPAPRGTLETDPFEHLLHEFLTQAAGSADVLAGVRDVAGRRNAIRTMKDRLSAEEYDALKVCAVAYLGANGIAADVDGIEAYPFRLMDHSLLSVWIVSNAGVLREQLPMLALLRAAHVLQPDFANVNEVLADIYFRTIEGADDDPEDFRGRARHHATLAEASMTESLRDPAELAAIGMSGDELTSRRDRMREILAALPG